MMRKSLIDVKHPDYVEGWDNSLEDLAKAVGKMRYDKVAEFIHHLENELTEQGINDCSNKRMKLGYALIECSEKLYHSAIKMKRVWEICSPHMKD